MTDFKVVLDDLQTLSSRYAAEAPVYEGVAAKLHVTPPDCGEGVLQQSLTTLMSELAILDSQMAESLRMYSSKLSDCRRKYQITEDDNKNRFLYDNIMDGVI